MPENTPHYNPLLGAVSARLRTLSPPALQDYLVREDLNGGVRQVEVWFRTKGCRLFLQGGCTMCNYGYSTVKAHDSALRFVQTALSQVKLNEATNLLVSPSGSLLDDWEVPPDVRASILEYVSGLPWRKFLFETQANYATEASLRGVTKALGGRPVVVGFGLESADDDVRRYSINKDLPWDLFESRVRLTRALGLAVSVNVLIGAPFLSPARQVVDTLRTIEAVERVGVDEIFLFPVNVKIGTLVAWLWENGYYQQPSLWALIHVLLHSSESARQKTSFAWHKPYYGGDSPVSRKVLARPHLDPSDADEPRIASDLLDAFLADRRVEPLREFADRSAGYSAWRQSLTSLPPRSDVARVINQLVDEVLGQDWRVRHTDLVRESLAKYQELANTWSP
jgi:radical SAM enzyme (TIGR01210 family)